MLQAAKQERRRLFNAAERERKSKNKTAAELAQEEREMEVKKKQQVCAVNLSTNVYRHRASFCTASYRCIRNSPAQTAYLKYHSCVPQQQCICDLKPPLIRQEQLCKHRSFTSLTQLSCAMISSPQCICAVT